MLAGESGDQVDTRFKQVLSVLENEDSKSLQSIFSKQALSEVADFDEQESALFAFLEGSIISWERTGLTSIDDIEGNDKYSKNISWYEVTTDKDTFIIFMIDCCTDTKNPENVGLYSLRVIKKADEETQLTYWQDMEVAGIYIP